MRRNASLLIQPRLSAAATLLVLLTRVTMTADPLPGRDLVKFGQQVMDGTTLTNTSGATERFWGHDEMSTAYSTVDANGPTPYRGTFMADDFADTINLPVVHIRWWGSYLNNFVSSTFPVDKFLISFESDVPADGANPFGRPGAPLLNQIVRRGSLRSGSGTFSEKSVSGGGPPLNETLYEYNAELHLAKPFPQNRNQIYWLKIVALVDLPAGIIIDPNQPPTFVPRWGWHNRDYTISNPRASTPPAAFPGEHVDAVVGGKSLWHFQSAAVTGSIVVDHLSNPDGQVSPIVAQSGYQPTRYLPLTDGPAAIGDYEKDLAFELYTLRSIPNPTLSLIKAVKPGLSNLVVGASYQLQVSSNLVIWTNHGAPFTATNQSIIYPQYFDVDPWHSLFFRARVAP